VGGSDRNRVRNLVYSKKQGIQEVYRLCQVGQERENEKEEKETKDAVVMRLSF
jgi:hypothetical protein